MPGEIERLVGRTLIGWAAHPREPDYPVVVHALVHGRIAASTIADQRRPDGRPGWQLELPDWAAGARLWALIGETDEWIVPAGPRPTGPLSVEDLLDEPWKRPWVTGACHLDGTRAGLLPETIIELLCRDYLGRPAELGLVDSAIGGIRDGGSFDNVRRMFVESPEYRQRRLDADAAPGTIFSQHMALAAASGDFVAHPEHERVRIDVSVRELVALEGRNFVAEAYRQVLRKEPDPPGLDHYTQQIAGGRAKAAILQHLAQEIEAVTAGVRLIDLD